MEAPVFAVHGQLVGNRTPLGRQGHIARRHLETPLAVVALFRGHISGLDRPSCKGIAFLGRLVNRHFLVVNMALGTAVHGQLVGNRTPLGFQRHVAGDRCSVITKLKLFFITVLRVIPVLKGVARCGRVSRFFVRRNRFAIFYIDIFRCRAVAVGVKLYRFCITENLRRTVRYINVKTLPRIPRTAISNGNRTTFCKNLCGGCLDCCYTRRNRNLA